MQLWQTAHDWLKANGNKADLGFCKQEITSHPEYPRLTSLVDFLDKGKLSYHAVQTDISCIEQFNYPVLAHIAVPGNQYVKVVRRSDEWRKRGSDLQYWSGIVIFSEPDSGWKNNDSLAFKRQRNRVLFIYSCLGLIILAAFGIASLYQSNSLFILFVFFSLVGAGLSFIALGTELGFDNQYVKQVCSSINSKGCEAVIQSPFAKGIAGISAADASLAYFCTQVVLYIISSRFPTISNAVVALAYTGVVVISWSLYTQAIILKQYCIVCLGIVLVLLAQGFIALSIHPFIDHFQEFGFFGGIYLTSLLGIVLIKRMQKTINEGRTEISKFIQWKANTDLFLKQWDDEPAADMATWSDDLIFGRSDAPLHIVVACNPFCNPCAETHKKLEKLIDQFSGKIKVQIRFLCKSIDVEDRYTKAVTAILKKGAVSADNSECRDMLMDWFKWMDYDKWVAKWQLSSLAPDMPVKERYDVTQRVKLHDDWTKDNGIQFTPTLFLNGKKIPGKYSIDDFNLLIPELAVIFSDNK